MTKLQIDRNNWLEARRHNAAQEAEAARHNQEQERLTAESNAELARAHQASEALTRSGQALEAQKISETVRSDLAREAETLRKNLQDHRDNRAIARMANSREWKKLDLSEQRTIVQNALDASKTMGQKIQNWLDNEAVKLNMPKQEYKRLVAQTQALLNEMVISQETLAETKRKNLADLTFAERKLLADVAQKEADRGVKIGSELTQLAGKMLTTIVTLAK